MKRKWIISFICLLVMTLFGGYVFLAGDTGRQKSTDMGKNREETEKPLIGVCSTDGSTSGSDAGTKMITANLEQLAEEAGVGILFMERWDTSAEGILDSARKQIEAGAKGIVVLPTTDTVMPSIVKLCEENGVYFSLTMRDIADEEIRRRVMDSEFYAGGICEDFYGAGYWMGCYLAEQGYHEIALISSMAGTFSTDQRELGIQQACEEYGMEIVSEVRGIQDASEAEDAVRCFLAAYPTLDVIVDVGNYIEGVTDTICAIVTNQGSSVHVATFMLVFELEKAMGSGSLDAMIIDAGIGSTYYDMFMAAVKVVNAVKGSKITGENGRADVSWPEPYVITKEEVQAHKGFPLLNKDASFRFYSADDLNSLFGWKSDHGLGSETFDRMLKSYDIYKDSPNYRQSAVR